MTFEELKEEAKKMGYEQDNFLGEALVKTIIYTMAFYKNGDIECNYDYVIVKHRTPDQMLAIMKALQ